MVAAVIAGRNGEEFSEHQYQEHDLGTRMVIREREWRYAQMGASAGVAGTLYQSEVPTSTWMTCTVDTARAAGATSISATLGGTNSVVIDEFNQGYVSIEDDAGEGHLYPIARAYAAGDANAAAAHSTALTVALAPGYSVQVALTTATTLSFFKNIYDEVIIHPSPATGLIVGVAMKAVTANYYCWLQVKGPASVLAEGTLVITEPVRASESTNGTVAALDYDEGSVGSKRIVGYVMDIGATTEHATIDLTLQ
jgi:hypothetical protein